MPPAAPPSVPVSVPVSVNVPVSIPPSVSPSVPPSVSASPSEPSSEPSSEPTSASVSETETEGEPKPEPEPKGQTGTFTEGEPERDAGAASLRGRPSAHYRYAEHPTVPPGDGLTPAQLWLLRVIQDVAPAEGVALDVSALERALRAAMPRRSLPWALVRIRELTQRGYLAHHPQRGWALTTRYVEYHRRLFAWYRTRMADYRARLAELRVQEVAANRALARVRAEQRWHRREYAALQAAARDVLNRAVTGSRTARALARHAAWEGESESIPKPEPDCAPKPKRSPEGWRAMQAQRASEVLTLLRNAKAAAQGTALVRAEVISLLTRMPVSEPFGAGRTRRHARAYDFRRAKGYEFALLRLRRQGLVVECTVPVKRGARASKVWTRAVYLAGTANVQR